MFPKPFRQALFAIWVMAVQLVNIERMKFLREYICCSILKVLLFHYMNHRKRTVITWMEIEAYPVSMVAREMVRHLFEDGIRKPNAIVAAFQNGSLKEPEKLKLKNFLIKLRQERFGPQTIHTCERCI
ncbi:hypothetical protein AVEN_141835-1 [Araneus ventricosus]|uniref:Uncharacterized protein n=1 Tax=Araneus ventricosus TaxID=182803 RepID=A0A4Y2IIL0_ARAVE|nr:hypothetical protein AVEN_141835-1 [Araneus ventricosus]